MFFLIGCSQVEEEEEKVMNYITADSAINSALENINGEILQTITMETEVFVFFRIKNEGALGIFTVYKNGDKYYINYEKRAMKANIIWGEYDSKLNGRLTAVMGKVPDDEQIEKVKLIGENSEMELAVSNKYFVIFNYQDTFRTMEYIK